VPPVFRNSSSRRDWKAFPNPNGVVCDVSEEADLMGATPQPAAESRANMLATVQMLCRSHRLRIQRSAPIVRLRFRPTGTLREGFIRQALGALLRPWRFAVRLSVAPRSVIRISDSKYQAEIPLFAFLASCRFKTNAMLTGSGASLVAGDLETRKSDPPHSLGALFAFFNQIPSDKGYLCGVYSQHSLAAGLARAFCSCGWSPGLNSLLTGSPDCKPGRRFNQLFQRYSRSLPEHFCSQAYGRPSRDRWWHCLDFGTPFHNLEMRGVTFCWEPSVPLWHCLDLARGPSMPDSLDGSASMFEIERISSHSHLINKRVFSGSKGFLAVTI